MAIDKGALFNSYAAACEKFAEFDQNNNLPEEIYAVAFHRRFVKKTFYFFSPYQPQILANPLIFLLPLKPTGKRVYEEVWGIAQQIIKRGSKYLKRENLWWEQKDWKDLIS